MFSPLLRVDDHADYVLSDSFSSPTSEYAFRRTPGNPLFEFYAAVTRNEQTDAIFKGFSVGPRPPEARVRTPRAKDTQVKGPFTLIRGCGLAVVSYYCPRTPPPVMLSC